MLPLAPARLSTTTCCPTASPTGAATTRATRSSPPPAPEETVQRIGFVGHAGACALTYDAALAIVSASAALMLMPDPRFICSPALKPRAPETAARAAPRTPRRR